jgi:hypothetical protein
MKKDSETTPAGREILPIKPSSVTIDFVTHTRKYMIVDIDPTLTLQDFNDHPNIWRLVQRDSKKALAADYVVELRSSEWTAFAKVNSVDDGGAVYLYDIHATSRPRRTVGLFSDAQYRIDLVGTRYAVFKVGNPTPHGGVTFETVKQAEQFINQQYGRKVA